MHTTTTSPSPLWAACGLPGDGPEFRFTAPRSSRTPLRSIGRWLRARRVWKEIR
jgi:hypothetical protein